MTVLTVWKSQAGAIKLHQLSDDHDAIVGYDTITREVGVATVETEDGPREQPLFITSEVLRYAPVPYDQQISHLAGLALFEGFSCVSADYNGPVPGDDPSLWRWNGMDIIAAVPVPVEVSARQALLALEGAGLLEAIEAKIRTMSRSVQIAWDKAAVFRRDDPDLNSIAEELGFGAQLDALFIAAAKI